MSQRKRQSDGLKKFQIWWDKHYLKVMIALGVVAVIMVTLAALLTFWVRLPEVPTKPTTGTDVSTEQGDMPSVTTTSSNKYGDLDRREGVYTFLVVGRDSAAGLTDTMILVTYDTVNVTVDAMSLPRDTMVNVSTSSKKLNAVYNYNKGSDPDTQLENGMTALLGEVEKLTAIYPDFYIMVDWDAVGELVDAIGGVWFDVPYNMDYDDPEQDLYIHQTAGYRLLTGEDAMQVIRHRQNNDGSASYGDVGRIAVQQDFLMAVAEQCLTPSILLKASSLITIFLEQVTTDLTFGNLLAFAQSAVTIDAGEDIHISTMPYVDHYRYSSYVLPVEEELLALLNDGLNPYIADITADQLELLYKVDSAGRMGVTNGELADPSIAEPPVYTSSSTDDAEEEVVEEPVEEEPSAEEQESSQSTGTEGETLFPQPEPELPTVEEEVPSTDDIIVIDPTTEETVVEPTVEETVVETVVEESTASITDILAAKKNS